MMQVLEDAYIPQQAEIVEHIEITSHIFTLSLRLLEPAFRESYNFLPGQFNMLYLFGVGEVPISLTAHESDTTIYQHTIRSVGQVTKAMSLLKQGDFIGLRGPYGTGWPVEKMKGKDILVVTGGLGCAASVAMIHYILSNRSDFGKLTILQGVKHSDDFIFRKRYAYWETFPDTEVHLAADISNPTWKWYTGLVTDLLDQTSIDTQNTIALICGPEAMMQAAACKLIDLQLTKSNIFLNLERNMECAIGHCGHCQFGGYFMCKDGPVFSYEDIEPLFGKKGF